MCVPMIIAIVIIITISETIAGIEPDPIPVIAITGIVTIAAIINSGVVHFIAAIADTFFQQRS